MEDNELIKFNATITFCKYYNSDSTWGVYGFSTEDDIPFYVEPTDNPFDDEKNKKKDNRKFSTLTGKMQELTIGAKYLVHAKYKKDKTYGDQYEPISVYALAPQTKEDQLSFLKAIIPEWMAENLIEAYPNVVNDVANGTLTTIDYKLVKGVREITWNRIKEKIINNYLISDIITMLKPLGVTYNMIKKLLSEEPNPMLLKQEIERNPWVLTRIDNLGFKRVDDLALRMYPSKINSMERLVSYITYYFTEMGESQGHTWCSESILKNAVTNNVPECVDKYDELIDNNTFLYRDSRENRIGLKYYHDIELSIYNILLNKSKIDDDNSIPDNIINQAIKLSEEEQGFEYTEEQIKVIKNCLSKKLSFITGKAGCGKSSIMRAILMAYKLSGKNIAASALSAMAAQRITEATNFPAATIHRTLGCQGFNKFLYNKDCKLITDIVFLDEGSMVNANLFLNWLEAINNNTAIIISGDPKQLPPIGYGNIFSDLLDVFGKDVVNTLNKPMRQAEKSGILVDANLIRDNINPITEAINTKIIHGELRDMYYMFRDNRQSLYKIAIKTFLKSVETEGIDNVVIAVPRRQGCLNSAEEINKEVQKQLLGNENKEIVAMDGTCFKLNAKVVQEINDYDKNVFNGDVGYITSIDKRQNGNKQEEYCIVTYNDIVTGESKLVEYTKKELGAINLAYAMTVHKLQGSGKHTVIGIVDNNHYSLLDNCMLYTMITRAKKRCLLLCEPQAYLKCIRTSHNRRNTWLQNVKNK